MIKKVSFLVFGILIIGILVLFFLNLPWINAYFLSQRTKKQSIENMTEDCKVLYEMYKSKSYENIELRRIYKKDDFINVDFKIISDVAYSEMNNTRDDLLFFCNNGNHFEKDEFYQIEFSTDSGNDWHVLSNFPDKDRYCELEKCADNPEKWWIYNVYFENWREIEENFNYVEGICRCKFGGFNGIEEADPSLWKNIKFLEIVYYGDDADIYEQKLKELFPEADVYVGK